MSTKPGHRPRSAWQGMRDPDSRGLTPNTLSKSVDDRSRQVSMVCDLELRPGPVLRVRPRTSANETRTETGAAPVPKGFQEHLWFTARRCCYLRCRYSGMVCQTRSSRVYPAHLASGRALTSVSTSREASDW